MSLDDALRRVLEEYAVDVPANQGLHGWRCEYPDRYGPCDCFEELVKALTDAVNSVVKQAD